MTDAFLKLLETTKDQGLSFIGSARQGEVLARMPGSNVTLGECLFPCYIPLPRDCYAVRVENSSRQESSLSFSKAVFAGVLMDGDGTIEDVGDHAECSQSSTILRNVTAKAGIKGDFAATNVHTGRDQRPWWRAEFSENVRLKHMFFHFRVDRYFYFSRRLRIVAVLRDGSEETVLQFGPSPYFRTQTADVFSTAIDAMRELDGLCSDEVRDAYRAKITTVIKRIDTLTAMVSKDSSFFDRLLAQLRRKFHTLLAERLGQESLKTLQMEIGQQLVSAIDLAVGGNRHFGLTPEDGLTVNVGAQKARYVRLRCHGERPYGLGGFELTEAGDFENPVVALKGRDLRLNFKRTVFSDPESYGLGLVTPIHTSVVDLKAVQAFDGFRTWNINRMNAANTLFLEVAVSDDRTNWTTIYDHGALYRNTLAALRLVDMFAASTWTPEYAHLLGKIFTQHRRKRIATLTAKLLRKNPKLTKAVFAGSDWMAARTKYAAPLKLGKHGLNVPLVYRNRDEVMSKLNEVCEKLKGFGYTPMLLYGTLLGAIREKGFIPHDDDLDLAIIADGLGPDELLQERDRLLEVFNENGLKSTMGARQSPLIHCQRPPITIDIFVLGHKDGEIHWPHKALKVVPERADIFLPYKPVELYGRIYDGPNDPEAVSEARYGADWNVPNPAFEW